MTPEWLVAVLTYGHIFSAIGWLGGALVTNLVIGPLMPRFAPATRMDLLKHFAGRFARITAAFAGLTVLFGLGLYVVLATESPAPSHTWFLVIGTGITLAAIAFVLGMAVIVPVSLRLERLARSLDTSPPGPPPPTLPRLLRRMQVSSFVGMLILLAVLAFMVSAAQI